MKIHLYLLALAMLAFGCNSQDDGAAITTTYSAAPTATDYTLTASNVSTSSLTLSWTKATDDSTDATKLTYKVYYSTQDNVDTYTDAETNGNAAGEAQEDIDSVTVSGLTAGASYYFNLVVEDGSGNKTAYTRLAQTMAATTSSSKAITAFGFTSALNSGAGVKADVTGTISGTNISATVPYGTTLTALKPTFTTTGTSVTIGGVTQTSGTTANDFSSSVTYRVTAQDSSTQDYVVTVSSALNDAKEITAFSFTSAVNGTLSSDYTGTISGTTITFYTSDTDQPYITKTQAANLMASFTTTGASVKVGSVSQTSGSSANDFTGNVDYLVTAANGTTQTYSVKVNQRVVLPDTGQTTCSDTSTALTCPTVGSAFYGQDAQYSSLNQPSYTDNLDGTVTDNLTGLVWQQCSAGLSGASCSTGTATTYTWSDALTYCSDNTAALPGTGWRLPKAKELSWILLSEGAAPYINGAFFPGTVAARYWSSTPYTLDSTIAWPVNFSLGHVVTQYQTNAYNVRCVR